MVSVDVLMLQILISCENFQITEFILLLLPSQREKSLQRMPWKQRENHQFLESYEKYG